MTGTLQGVALITPTYLGDLDRFDVLRASVARFAPGVEHVVVVDTEDLPSFEHVRHEPGVRLLTTAEVLPRRIEEGRVAARRRRRPLRRTDPRFWVTPRAASGWKIQQIVKLAAPRLTDAEVVLAIDSDCFLVRPLERSHLIGPSGRPWLIETEATEAQTASWLLSAMRELGTPLAGAPLHQYIQCPTVLTREVLLRVQSTLAGHHRSGWEAAFLRSGSAEYQLHGVQAGLVEGYRAVEARPRPLGVTWWTPDTYPSIDAFVDDVVHRVECCAAALNSSLRLPSEMHRSTARRTWDATSPT